MCAPIMDISLTRAGGCSIFVLKVENRGYSGSRKARDDGHGGIFLRRSNQGQTSALSDKAPPA